MAVAEEAVQARSAFVQQKPRRHQSWQEQRSPRHHEMLLRVQSIHLRMHIRSALVMNTLLLSAPSADILAQCQTPADKHNALPFQEPASVGRSADTYSQPASADRGSSCFLICIHWQ